MKRFPGIAMMKSVIPGSSESFGQDVFQDQEEKVSRRKGAGFSLVCIGFFVFEGDLSINVTDNVTFPDDTSIQILRQVFQRRLTTSCRLDSDNP